MRGKVAQKSGWADYGGPFLGWKSAVIGRKDLTVSAEEVFLSPPDECFNKKDILRQAFRYKPMNN